MIDDAEPLEVEVNNQQSHLPLEVGRLAELARHVLTGEGVSSASISIVLVDNAMIQALNREHLGHDWPTDVITFPLSGPMSLEGGAPPLEGELILSAEMAVTTALQAGADPRDELALYMVHGLLHLCGYDDQTPDDARAMRRREAEVLARAGVTNTFPMAGPDASGLQGRESVTWPG